MTGLDVPSLLIGITLGLCLAVGITLAGERWHRR